LPEETKNLPAIELLPRRSHLSDWLMAIPEAKRFMLLILPGTQDPSYSPLRRKIFSGYVHNRQVFFEKYRVAEYRCRSYKGALTLICIM
jgi:hypothetical protein